MTTTQQQEQIDNVAIANKELLSALRSNISSSNLFQSKRKSSSLIKREEESVVSSIRSIDPEVLNLLSAAATASSPEQSVKKMTSYRYKPYNASSSSSPTAEYNSGSWSAAEHEAFLKGFQENGRRWKVISQLYVKTRSRSQVAAHAQKYFAKLKATSNE